MRTLVAILAILFPLTLLAGGVYRDEEADLVVQLQDVPCRSAKVLAMIHPDIREGFKNAVVVQRGRNYEACWGEPPKAPDMIFIVDERGATGGIERAAIKPAGNI